MIKTLTPTIFLGSAPVTPATESPIERALPGPLPMAREVPRAERLEVLAGVLELVWRYVRRMGFSEGAADDVAQEAFCIAAARVDAIEVGKERAYLLSTAIHLVRRERTRNGRLQALDREPEAARAELPDARLDDERARRLLDRALASLDDDVREVFVLHEIEELTMAEIAVMIGVPSGTVASRLRRAREDFKKATARLRREGRPA
ncbi:MAG: RNA polymerase sigma factor [Polyangiaceae bacterium]